MIRVVLADDHNLVRAGFRSLLQSIADLEIVAEADNGLSALELIQQHQPDIALLDISMPGLNGLQVTERLFAAGLTVRVILISMFNDQAYIQEALRLGASGYLLKEASSNELETAVQVVSRGGAYLSPAISRQIIDAVSSAAAHTQPVATPEAPGEPAPSNPNPNESLPNVLSPRQLEVLQLIAEGCTTKEIAYRLRITAKTVEAHRTQLMKELDIHNIAGLVRYAIRHQLIQ